MDINRVMLLLSGCFAFVWATFKWKYKHVIWDLKFVRVYSAALGIYNIILSVLFDKNITSFLLLDIFLYFIMDIAFIVIKLMKNSRKNIIIKLQLRGASIFIALAFVMALSDANESYAGIMILSGMMMVISTPFEEFSVKSR